MDFPVKATVHLTVFSNKTKVRELLRSHDFETTDLSRDQLLVNGSFLKLKAVKTHLEQLVDSQIQTETPQPPRTSSRVQSVSSGAISKSYTNKSNPWSGGKRGRLASGDELLHISPPSSNPASWTSNTHSDSASSGQRASFSSGADQCASVRRGSHESFVVDADLYRYAAQIKKRHLDSIIERHKIQIIVREFADSADITLRGSNRKMAATELQGLLKDLNSSLRTQEVLLKDMSQEGKVLLQRIQRNRNVHDLVLVSETSERLRLIGPSSESYKVKRELLGRPVQQSRRTGRTFEKNCRGRSSSLPPVSRQNNERDDGAYTQVSPVGAAGYSPSQEVVKLEQEAAGACLGQSGTLRRSYSETRGRKREDKTDVFVQERDNKRKLPHVKQKLVFTDNIKQKFKGLRK